MTAVAKLGKFEIRFTGGATRAYDRACFNRDESVFAVVGVAEQKSTATSRDPFTAISHEYRITNSVVVAREEDSPIKSFTATVTGERYRGSRGRLLAFKNTR
jgi:hypothetical protein